MPLEAPASSLQTWSHTQHLLPKKAGTFRQQDGVEVPIMVVYFLHKTSDLRRKTAVLGTPMKPGRCLCSSHRKTIAARHFGTDQRALACLTESRLLGCIFHRASKTSGFPITSSRVYLCFASPLSPFQFFLMLFFPLCIPCMYVFSTDGRHFTGHWYLQLRNLPTPTGAETCLPIYSSQKYCKDLHEKCWGRGQLI